MYEIETGIPVPPPPRGRPKGHCKYPFASLEIGQSFLVPDRNQNAMATYSRVWRQRNDSDRRFSARKVEGGVRIWRVA